MPPKIVVPDLVMGLAGHPDSGKSTAARILGVIFADEISMVSSGMILREILRKLRHPDADSVSTQQNCYSVFKGALANERWLHIPIKKRWEESQKPHWGFDGVRMPWDVELIQSYPRWIIFYISCAMERRFERAKLRSQKKDHSAKRDEKEMTWEYFRKLHEHETARSVSSIERRPGVTILNNNGTPRELGAQIIVELSNNQCFIDPERLARRKDALESLYREISKPR